MKVVDLKTKNQAEIIRGAVEVLCSGGLMIYPTETCYGLGADATNPTAIKKLLEFKGERQGKPVSIAVADIKMAQKYVEINVTAQNLYKNFLPGPLTVVSKSKRQIVTSLESVNQTLGIRIPNYPLVIKIIKAFGKPITATSANSSGKKTPYSLADIQKYTSSKRLYLVDLFLDAGVLPPRPPSTVVDTTLNETAILRQGEIRLPEIFGQNFTSGSEKETQIIAQKIFNKFQAKLKTQSLIFALQGELGSGKTQFAKGLGSALNIKSIISSPTFILLREYPLQNGMFYHLDTWRMEKGEELRELGLGKMLRPGNIIAIEWLQKVRSVLENIPKTKATIVWVTIETLAPIKRRIKYVVS